MTLQVLYTIHSTLWISLWYYNKVPLDYPLKILRKMQQRAVLWISDAFQTLPTRGIEAISCLLPIYLHIKKLYNQFHSRGFFLSHNHIIRLILSSDRPSNHYPYDLSLKTLTFKQRLHLNSFLIDMDNKKNEFLPSFDPLNHEFFSGHRLIDLFPYRFSFHLWEKNVKNHIKNLDDITLTASSNFSSIVMFDTNIKNLVAMSISYIHMHNKPTIKTIHCAINVISTEVELFAICCGINQFVGFSQVKKIIVITDFLHITKNIFDSLMHSYQIHSTAISHKLREFFM